MKLTKINIIILPAKVWALSFLFIGHCRYFHHMPDYFNYGSYW
jgi:hypothetical protein